jgi:hypothetical protein
VPFPVPVLKTPGSSPFVGKDVNIREVKFLTDDGYDFVQKFIRSSTEESARVISDTTWTRSLWSAHSATSGHYARSWIDHQDLENEQIILMESILKVPAHQHTDDSVFQQAAENTSARYRQNAQNGMICQKAHHIAEHSSFLVGSVQSTPSPGEGHGNNLLKSDRGDIFAGLA